MASIGVKENVLRSFANKMSFTVKLDQERREFLKQLMANLTKMKLREESEDYSSMSICPTDEQSGDLLTIGKPEKKKRHTKWHFKRDTMSGKRLSIMSSLGSSVGGDYDGEDESYGAPEDLSSTDSEANEITNANDIVRMLKMEKTSNNNSANKATRKQDSCVDSLLTGHKAAVLCLGHIGTTLFSGSADGSVRIWDTHGGMCIGCNNVHKNWVSCMDVNKENNTVISGSYDRTISITDIESARMDGSDCKYRLLCGHTGPVTCVRLHPRGILSASADSTVCLWDPRTRKEAMTLKGHLSGVTCIDFSGENAVVSGGKDFMVKLWDLRMGKPTFDFPRVHRDWVRSCLILDSAEGPGAGHHKEGDNSENGVTKIDGIEWKFLSCGYDGVIVQWDPLKGEQMSVVEQNDMVVNTVRWSNGKLVSATTKGLINVWNGDMMGDPNTVQWESDGEDEEITALDTFNDFVVSSASNGTIKVWNPNAEDSKFMCRQTLQTSSRKTTCFCQYDSYSFASAGWDGTIQLWSFPADFR